MGGHLARPGRADLEELIKYAKKNTDMMFFYIDACDKKKEGVFVYSTGKEMPGDNLWESGQPDNRGGKQHCGAISKLSSNRLLDDVECETLFQYICQFGESEPDPIPECTKIGDGCYIYVDHPKTWPAAVDACVNMGGILASPCKKQMKHLTQHTVAVGGRWWIGASDMDKNQEYMFVKGNWLPGGFWNCGEPNNHGGNEDCIEISGCTGKLNDINCASPMPFICEIGDGGCDGQEARNQVVDDCIMIGSHCYIIENEDTATWKKAEKECQQYPSGQLAAPDRDQMPLLIEHMINLGGRFWIAATDKQSQGSYHYPDGNNMPGGYWIAGEPNQCGGSGEDCVEIKAASMGLADENCQTKLNYICEIMDKQTARTGPTTPECTNFGTSCFWINENDKLSWEEAKGYCETTGGYLASPTNSNDMDLLMIHIAPLGGKYWIGATDTGKEGKYKYVTGTQMIQGYWVCGEPNQGCGGEEDCIGLWAKKQGFYDEKCDARLRFICQYGEVARQGSYIEECEQIGSGCFTIVTSMHHTWHDAKASCESAGAKLAHPNKNQMRALLEHLHSHGDRYWIGGNDMEKEGDWSYPGGQRMPLAFWSCGEPNSYNNNENCVELWAAHKSLNDLDCETQLPFVCQVEREARAAEIEPVVAGCGYEEIGSSCFMVEPDDKLTWTQAQKFCEDSGMTLATPTNEDLQLLLNHVAHIGGRFWIGAQDYGSSFQFLGGSDVPCLWGPGYPEYKEDQKCVEIYAKYKALADGNCETRRNFICQKTGY